MKSCKFHITLNIHCFNITIFIFNQFSISILCGVMFIIMIFDAQILVSWLLVDVHIVKTNNSTLLCQYFIHTHTHTHFTNYKLPKFILKKKFWKKNLLQHMHKNIHTQRNSEFNNYKKYKLLNITKKNKKSRITVKVKTLT